MNKFFTELIVLSVVSVIFLFSSIALEGIVLFYLWMWFVVPLGVPAIGFLNALGLGLIVSFLTYHYYDFKKNDEAGIYEPLCYLFVRPGLTLLVGWTIHCFM